MKLAIIDKDGVVHDVIDNLEEYNLNKPMARSTVCDEIMQTAYELGDNRYALNGAV